MYSKKWINVVSFILAIIIFIIVNIILNNISIKSIAAVGTKKEAYENKDSLNKQLEEKINKNTFAEQDENTEEKKWEIQIPAISLVANISEGTDEETLNKYVGHFTITSKKDGNIGLAAHNRGYPVNYFANLKNLEGGEEIIYTYGNFTKTYIVKQNIKISDIDWSYLQSSNENKITLITCIANEPAYRRCVQATEKEEN